MFSSLDVALLIGGGIRGDKRRAHRQYFLSIGW